MSRLEHSWNNESPAITGIEQVINAGKGLPMPDAASWHSEASVRADSIAPDKLARRAVELVRSLPYEELVGLIQDATTNNEAAFQRARMARKLFIIARDAIAVSTDKVPSSDFNYLRTSCRLLGQFADTHAQNPEIAAQTQESVKLLGSIEYRLPSSVSSLEFVKNKIQAWLHSDDLISAEPDTTSGVYHQWRKEFRKVMNTYILLAALGEDTELRHFAGQGTLLNMAHGDTNDAIDKQRNVK